MFRCNVFLITLFLVLSAGLCLATRADADDAFTLNAYPLAGDYFAVVAIWCAAPGQVATLASTTGTMDETTRLVVFRPEAAGLEAVGVLNVPGYSNDEQTLFPKLLLRDNTLLGKGHDPAASINAEFRSGSQFKLYDPATRASTDITPANLFDTPPWTNRAGPAMLWSEEQGLALFLYVPETQCVALWQGREQLTEVQRTPPILACGRTFVDGRLTWVEVTESGAVLIYNYETGKLDESSAYAAIGGVLANVLPEPTEEPTHIVLTPDLAIYKDKEHSAFIVLSADGKQLSLPRVTRPDQTLEEYLDSQDPEVLKNLDEQGREELAKDYLLGYEKEAGRELPPDVITMGSYITPVDETRVGVFDLTYQRLITIELAE